MTVLELQLKMSWYTNLSHGIAIHSKRKSKSRFRDLCRSLSWMSHFALNLSRIRESNNINLLCGFGALPLLESSVALVPCRRVPLSSRAWSYNAGATRWERGVSAGFYARFIDLSPSTFTLPSHMPHPTSAFPWRHTFLVASHDAVGKPEKTSEKQDIFCVY